MSKKPFLKVSFDIGMRYVWKSFAKRWSWLWSSFCQDIMSAWMTRYKHQSLPNVDWKLLKWSCRPNPKGSSCLLENYTFNAFWRCRTDRLTNTLFEPQNNTESFKIVMCTIFLSNPNLYSFKENHNSLLWRAGVNMLVSGGYLYYN